MVNLSIPAVACVASASDERGALPRLASCAAVIIGMLFFAPLWAQTPAAPARSSDRTDDPAYSVFRWIKIQGDAQRKPDTPKPKPKAEPAAAAPVRRPEAQATAPVTTTERPQASITEAPAPGSTGATNTAPARTAQQPAPTDAVPVSSAPVAPVTAAAPAAAVVAEANEELDADLKIISQAQPDFPRELRTVISHGKVVVSFTVQPDGTVAEPTVVSYTNRKLGKAATDAVSKWVFEPVRIPRTVQVEIAFNAQ